MKEIVARTLVIGSGCAGLNAADWLATLGQTDVLLITEGMNAGTSRNTGSDKQTYYKLSLSGDEGDSVGALARTLSRVDVDGDIALCEAAGSAQSFLKLAGLGVPFPTNEMGEYVGYQTDHDERRRASSAGPLTSKYMTEALEASVKNRGVCIVDNVMATRICTDEYGVCGLDAVNLIDHTPIRFRCVHIVLATGGPAAIYQNRVYPESQLGMSGMALGAGAVGANLDCWQYGLASTAFRWNVSGSYQQAIPYYVSIDEDGVEHDFLHEHLTLADKLQFTFLKGYQWPFDARRVDGSSRIDLLVKAQEDMGRRVYMDYRRNPSGYDIELLSDEARDYLVNCSAALATPLERLRAINAPAIALYQANGIDLETQMLEIRVCAQHHNGGIAVDSNWQSSIAGLYVCGEAAGTFGAYRPGGTALNSTQVGSMRAAMHIARQSERITPETIDAQAPLLLPVGDAKLQTAQLQALMTRYAAFERSEEGMLRLLAQLDAIAWESAADGEQLVDRLRLRDIIITQRAVLSAMLYRLRSGEAGVLETRNAVSTCREARPIPSRDLWFERVWRKYRDGNKQHTD